MKKLMFGLMGAAAMVAFGVESSNIVGYNTIPVQKELFQLIGVQFQGMAAADGKISFSELISLKNLPAVPFNQRLSKGLELQVRDGETYKMYYYVSDAYDEEADEEVEGWADSRGDLVSEASLQSLGGGFWLYARSFTDSAQPASISLSGEVSPDTSKDVSFGNGFTIVANPFPKAVSLQEVTLNGVEACKFSERFTKGIELQVRDGETYKMYYYVSDAYDEAADEEVEGWSDSRGDLASGNEVSVGASFWVSAKQAGSLTFSR